MKLDFNSTLEKINDGFTVRHSDVSTKALNRKIWIAEWHIPGCLSESQSICLNKSDAIACALFFAETENGPPRGMKTNLNKYGRFDSHSELYGDVITTISQCRLSDIF